MDKNKLYAVITGDIVGSSRAGNDRSFLLDALKNAFDRMQSIYRDQSKTIAFDIFRGDSFQGVISNPGLALAASLIIRSTLRKNQPSGQSSNWDARTAIGIGMIDYLPKNISEGDGEAYRRSGPCLDKMKKEQRLSIITPWKEVNEEMKAQASLFDAIIAKWSPQQAEVVLELLEGKSREEIGKVFDISQAAVHYRVKGSGWFGVEKFLDRYQIVLNERMRE